MMYVKGTKTGFYGDVPFIWIKQDLKGTFTDAATELAKYGVNSGFAIALVEETNVTGAGKRLYMLADGDWNYVALT
jgi:hypothetical protein